MPVFETYASYYDLIYRGKDYAGEAEFVLRRLARDREAPQTVLDLGCGTGRHAAQFARHGVAVTGVDMSEMMVALGRDEIAVQDGLSSMPTLVVGDARTVRLEHRFDAVVSLFHVASYQTSEDDLEAYFQTAFVHLDPGGRFLFDFWHGPGVVVTPPEDREKHLEDDHIVVDRSARPVHDLSRHLVDVNYDVRVTHKTSGELASFVETHRMRYWFLPEIAYIARRVGFTVVEAGAWMETRAVTRDDWTAWVMLQR